MAIIGAILGDIAGSQYEFHRPYNLSSKTCDLFTNRCIFTDDTVMSLAVKYAILNNISFSDSYRLFGEKYPNMSYGSKFRIWLHNKNLKAYNSCGNGSAMRVSYIGEYYNTEQEVIDNAIKTAECTHNHKEGIKGAVTTAMCIYMAKTGASKKEIYLYAKSQYPKEDYKYSVEIPVEEYVNNYKWNEICQDSVPVAIRCFIESECYESFLRKLFSLECDMDTLGAIGGGIAEEFYHNTGYYEDKLLKKYLDKNLYELVKI